MSNGVQRGVMAYSLAQGFYYARWIDCNDYGVRTKMSKRGRMDFKFDFIRDTLKWWVDLPC